MGLSDLYNEYQEKLRFLINKRKSVEQDSYMEDMVSLDDAISETEDTIKTLQKAIVVEVLYTYRIYTTQVLQVYKHSLPLDEDLYQVALQVLSEEIK